MIRAVALRRHGRGAVVRLGAATGALAGLMAGAARAEGASGRWQWPSLLPPALIQGDAPPIRAAEKKFSPPPLSPGPQTSHPVFTDENLERMRLARIRRYEEDIRKLSTAEKVYSYFASSVDENGIPRMTPHDLLRAMVSTVSRRG